MEWWLVFFLLVGGAVALMLTGLPMAFAFLIVSFAGVFWLWGGAKGVDLLIRNMHDAVSTFILVPVPLFILLGEVAFQSGMAIRAIDVIDKWLGRLPGRLGLVTIASGTLLGTLSGVTTASIAMLGTTLVPEMERRGYKKPMSLGPVLGSGGLAMMIPPTSLGVFLAALAKVSVGDFLIAIIVPGLVMAALYSVYTVGRCYLQPSIAPSYDVVHTPLKEKLAVTMKYVVPLGFIIFLVTGVIFLGIATPSEAAATGCIGAFILASIYRGMNWNVVKAAVTGSLRVTAMIFIVMATAKVFSQILAFSGASKGMLEFALGLPLAPIAIIIAMQVILLFMGTFMSAVGIIMITIPVFMPIVHALGFSPLWFSVMYLLNLEMAQTTPPVGWALYVMKGVAPPDTTIGDIYKAAIPYLVCDAIVMVLMLAFPSVALWLPSLMRY